MGEMQIIGGYDLSTLAGKVCSFNSAQFALMSDVVGEISGLHFRPALAIHFRHSLGFANSCK